MSNQWHGLDLGQWVRLWDLAGWRTRVARTIYEVARCGGAAVADRLLAIQALNEGIVAGALAPDPGYPEMMRDVFLEIVEGRGKRPLFGRKRLEERMHDRLTGARWTLQTAYQFLGQDGRTEHGADIALLS